jgi:hypothetical protein
MKLILKRGIKYLDYCHSLAMPLLYWGCVAKRSFTNQRTNTRHARVFFSFIENVLGEQKG